MSITEQTTHELDANVDFIAENPWPI
jgi:hypothetical protein